MKESDPSQLETTINPLHVAAKRLVEGLTTIYELQKDFSPRDLVRILSHAEKISLPKPTEVEARESFINDGLEDPQFEVFFEENYMQLIEAHPDLIHTYLKAARSAYKELHHE